MAKKTAVLEYLFEQFDDTSGLKNLFIDLSPFSKEKEDKDNEDTIL